MKWFSNVRNILFGSIIAGAILCSACALFGPTPTGQCPQITTTTAEGVAYAGGLAALKGKAPAAVLTGIASNIDASVVSGKFDGTLIENAIAKSGGKTWAQALGGIEILFGNQWQAAVDGEMNGQVCTVPVLKSISAGLKLSVALGGKTAAAKLAPFTKK